MVHSEEIDQAIAAHGYWKAYLLNAIKTGQIDIPVEMVRSDNQCIFGRWLATCPLEDISHHFIAVKERHEEFHKTAARVVELVLAGKKDDAEKMMSPDGEYARISTELTLAMMAWKKGLGK
jgi:hypothetical protein